MIETLLGGLLGGITRLAPELFKFFDAKNARKHEIDMFDRQLKADDLRTANQLKVIDAEAAGTQFTSALSALQEAVKGQGARTGNAILDGINALVRPTVTYIVFAMWVIVKVNALYIMTFSMDMSQALPLWWDASDKAMLAGILNFWFMGRVFDKALR